MKYPVFFEKDIDSDFGVSVPDLPGCFSAGTTLEEAYENAQEAILTHIEGLLLDDETIPQPSSLEKLKNSFSSPEYTWALIQVDLSKLKKNTKRINVSIPLHILTKIDAYASKEGQTRSGLFTTAALEYISKA